MRMDILEIQDMYRDIDMYVLCLESAFHMDYIERYMDFSAGKNIFFFSSNTYLFSILFDDLSGKLVFIIHP